jgi:hypothetical protein
MLWVRKKFINLSGMGMDEGILLPTH